MASVEPPDFAGNGSSPSGGSSDQPGPRSAHGLNEVPSTPTPAPATRTSKPNSDYSALVSTFASWQLQSEPNTPTPRTRRRARSMSPSPFLVPSDELRPRTTTQSLLPKDLQQGSPGSNRLSSPFRNTPSGTPITLLLVVQAGLLSFTYSYSLRSRPRRFAVLHARSVAPGRYFAALFIRSGASGRFSPAVFT